MTVLPTPPGGDVTVATSWWDGITIGQIIIGIIAVLALLVVAVKAGRAIARLVKAVAPLENFFRDWNGEKARDGVPARPGMMSRMASMESHLEDSVTRAEHTELQREIAEAVRRPEFAELERQVVRNTARLDLVLPKSLHVTEEET